jgi:long-chain fatty acid transport protein
MTLGRVAGGVAGVFAVVGAQAANYGTDLNLTMMPASGGMAGVGIAAPLEPAAALYGNPASLTQFSSATHFSFGATYYDPSVDVKHDGSVTGAAWSGSTQTKPYLVPTVAVTMPITANDVVGAGLTVVSGIGSDFRGEGGPHPAGCPAGGGVFCSSASLDPNAELIVFGANVGYAHRFSNNFSAGAAVTVAQGYAQLPMNSDTSSVHAFGVRATVGGTYEGGPLSIGAYYRSPLKINYRNLTNDGPGVFNDFKIEQPQEVALGLASRHLMGGALLVAMDVIYKDWDSAEFYRDFYKSQTVVALGAQLTTGAAQWRVGYSHVNSPMKKDLGNSIGGAGTFGLNGVSVPITPAVIQYFQAVDAEVIWQDQVSAGAGLQLNRNLRIDGHVNFALSEKDQIGGTQVDAKAWQAGLGATWSF